MSQFTPDMHVRYEAAFHNDLVPMRMTASKYEALFYKEMAHLKGVSFGSCVHWDGIHLLDHELEMHWGKGLTSHAVNLPKACFPSF